MATATVLGLRGARGRPLVLLPALVLMWTALLWEPGQKVFANGFTAFWLGAVAAGVALLIAVSSTRPTLPDVAAVAGLLLLVSHCWLPLVVLAAPAAVLVFVPLFGVPWSRRATVAVLLLVAGGLGAMKAALVLIETVPLGVLVSADGGYDAPALLPVLMLVLAGSWALLILGSKSSPGSEAVSLRPGQARLLLITPVAGVIMLSALFVVQVRSTGTTAYYFVKLLLGYELILAVVVPALVAGLAVALLPPRKRKLPGILGSVAMSLGALAAFGVITPSQASLFNEDASGTASIAPPYSRAGMADGILAAARANDPSTGFRTVYVALGSASAAELFYPDSSVPRPGRVSDRAGDDEDDQHAPNRVHTR